MYNGKILGVPISNPIIISSNNITDNERNILKLFSYGASAVTTKTIYSGKYTNQTAAQIIKDGNGVLYNSTAYSSKSIEEWSDIINRLVQRNLFIIPSIFAETPEKLAQLACHIEQLGVKALEIGLSCPNDADRGNYDIFEYTKQVCDTVGVPVTVKLSIGENLVDKVNCLLKAGATAVTLSDSLSGICKISRNEFVPMGYSGHPIKPLVLTAIHTLRSHNIFCDIIGVGGVINKEDVYDFLKIGANATGICSGLYFNGIKYIKDLVKEVNEGF